MAEYKLLIKFSMKYFAQHSAKFPLQNMKYRAIDSRQVSAAFHSHQNRCASVLISAAVYPDT